MRAALAALSVVFIALVLVLAAHLPAARRLDGQRVQVAVLTTRSAELDDQIHHQQRVEGQEQLSIDRQDRMVRALEHDLHEERLKVKALAIQLRELG